MTLYGMGISATGMGDSVLNIGPYRPANLLSRVNYSCRFSVMGLDHLANQRRTHPEHARELPLLLSSPCLGRESRHDPGEVFRVYSTGTKGIRLAGDIYLCFELQ